MENSVTQLDTNGCKSVKDNAAVKLARIRKWHWQKGQSGNPAGGHRHDLASAIARAAFESDPKGIQRATLRQLRSGSVRAFEILANRAYGLLPRPIDIRMAATVVNIPAELVEMVNELDEK